MSERPQRSDDPVAAALRKAFADQRPPHGLERRLARSLRMLPSAARTVPIWRRFAMTAAAAVLILLLAVTPSGPRRAELADVPLKEVKAFIDSNRSVDVETDDPTWVRAWLAQRVTFAPPPVAQGSTKIELIGGRLCLFTGRRVASYMYRVQGRLLSIYVMTAAGLNPIGGTRIEREGRTLGITREGHFTQASWSEDGLIYSAVGELSEPGLLAALDELKL